jgi:hypothetical protein
MMQPKHIAKEIRSVCNAYHACKVSQSAWEARMEYLWRQADNGQPLIIGTQTRWTRRNEAVRRYLDMI